MFLGAKRTLSLSLLGWKARLKQILKFRRARNRFIHPLRRAMVNKNVI